MLIINPGSEDYHMHSFNFSDGWATIEEIVKYAGEIGLTKIAITDHSEKLLHFFGYGKKSPRTLMSRWRNVHNDVEVTFGVEGDLLNEEGDICSHIQGIEADFLILSAHDSGPQRFTECQSIYEGNPSNITEAYLKALKRHSSRIKFIGHPCAHYFEKEVDIEAVVRVANEYGVPLEFNCANLVNGKTNLDNLHKMLRQAERIYVNSDAHTLYELGTVRKTGFKWLREEGYVK